MSFVKAPPLDYFAHRASQVVLRLAELRLEDSVLPALVQKPDNEGEEAVPEQLKQMKMQDPPLAFHRRFQCCPDFSHYFSPYN